ncbi:MAG: hypothetical protein ACI8Q1_002210 [Parvicella sp.]|jgi:hypothetical protein
MASFVLSHELKSHFLNLYSIALSDTEVDVTELEFLYKLGRERGVSKDEIEKVLLQPHNIKFHVPADMFEKIDNLYDFARLILADGRVDEFEIQALRKFCLKFGFEKKNVNALSDFLVEEAGKGTDKAKIFEIVRENL